MFGYLAQPLLDSAFLGFASSSRFSLNTTLLKFYLLRQIIRTCSFSISASASSAPPMPREIRNLKPTNTSYPIKPTGTSFQIPVWAKGGRPTTSLTFRGPPSPHDGFLYPIFLVLKIPSSDTPYSSPGNLSPLAISPTIRLGSHHHISLTIHWQN